MESTAYWLQVLGWKEFEPLDMASLLLGSGVGAFLLLTLAGMDPFTTLLGSGLAPFLASMWVQNRVRKAVRAVQRELPYTVTRISLEVAQGRSLLAALQEASRGSGPMADLLRRCLARGMGILSAVIDELIGEAEKSGLRELKEFALILETLQRTPKGLSEVLLQIARDAATDYQNRAITSAEKLKTRLALQTVFTFLLPYVAYLMLPVGSRIVQLLSLG
jgi:Flp pilus assembly protein TadB